MSDAIILCRDGWQEGADRVARIRDKISASHPRGPRFVHHDVAGAYPNVQRAIAGNPMAMRCVDSVRLRRKPVITLLSNMTANSDVPAAAITNRAAVVAAIVDVVEAAGYACHVIGFSCSQANDVSVTVGTTIKESYQPVDLARLAFGLGHASMFRRLAWVPIVENRFTIGIGRSLGKALDFDGSPERGIYMVDSPENCHGLFNTEDSAETQGLDHLVAHLVAQGCPAFPGH